MSGDDRISGDIRSTVYCQETSVYCRLPANIPPLIASVPQELLFSIGMVITYRRGSPMFSVIGPVITIPSAWRGEKNKINPNPTHVEIYILQAFSSISNYYHHLQIPVLTSASHWNNSVFITTKSGFNSIGLVFSFMNDKSWTFICWHFIVSLNLIFFRKCNGAFLRKTYIS